MRHKKWFLLLSSAVAAAAACLVIAACSSNTASRPDADVVLSDEHEQRAEDSVVSDAADLIADQRQVDTKPDEAYADSDSAEAETMEPVPELGALAVRPTSSLVPEGITSCAVYYQTRCEQGTLQRCDLFDSGKGDWATQPDHYAEQIFWFDRYFDLYHRMERQQSEFLYTESMQPGTPESVWGSPEKFQTYTGHWDSAGWTGTALQAAAARFATTGTDADYERMVDQLESMMFMYEATGAPGLLMRCHYAMLEEGAPNPIGHPGKALIPYSPPEVWADRNPMAPEYLAQLPAYYTEGVDIQGNHYATTPFFMSDSSRDMYVRSLPGILLGYDLLGDGEREEKVRKVIKTTIPCTLKRMKKLRIVNLQDNTAIKEAIAAYFGVNSLQLDPGDIDLTALDTVIGYVMEQPNPDYPDAFNSECPDSLPMEVSPEYDLDAAADGFLLDFVEIMGRVGKGKAPIAWIMIPSVRGSDALFMTQWALVGHYLTGDIRFLEFQKRLTEETQYWPVINTMGSFWLPKWCKSHYGPSLLYPTFWNLQNRISRTSYPTFWYSLGRAVKEEFKEKELVDANDAYFGVLYDSMVDESIDPDAHTYAQEMVVLLRETGQYQAQNSFEPMRSYNTDLLNNPPPEFSVPVEDLSQQNKEICLKPIEIFGVKFEGQKMEDEFARAIRGLPIKFRISGPFQWQEDPFQLYRDYGDRNGRTQWPMQGFSAAYWTGRLQGTITDGAGLGLGWRDLGEACSASNREPSR